MKKIKLTQGMFAIVEDGDFESLNQYKWHYGNKGYAVRAGSRKTGNYGKKIFMHKQILGSLFEIDHINGNCLDNRRCNLRLCNHAQNVRNIGTPKNNTSGFKGVGWYKNKNRWRATLTFNGKLYHLGFYKDIKKAIEARLKAEIKYFGEFRRPSSSKPITVYHELSIIKRQGN